MSTIASFIIHSIIPSKPNKQSILYQSIMLNQSNAFCVENNNANVIQLVVVGPVIDTLTTTTHQQINTYLNYVQKKLAQCISGFGTQFDTECQVQLQLKQLIKIFSNFSDEQSPEDLRITLTCINLIALLLYHKGKEIFCKQERFSLKKFVSRVCNLDLDIILTANPKIEYSIIYLLSVMRLMPSTYLPTNLKRYKSLVLKFLDMCSSSQKINFNILKLVFDLQKKNIFDQKDFPKFKVIQNILRKVIGQSQQIQIIAYNIIIKQKRTSDAFNLLEANLKGAQAIQSQELVLNKFLSALSCYPEVLDIDKYICINKILTEYKIKPPLAYYKILSIIVEKLSVTQYLDLLEGTLLQHFDSRWMEVKSSNFEKIYFELYLRLLRMGKNLPISNLLLSRFAVFGFESNFVETVGNCQCKQLYGVLRELYVEFLRGHITDSL